MPDEIAEGLPPAGTKTDVAIDVAPDIRAVQPTAMEVVFAWEKLRLLYNGILIVAVSARWDLLGF
jgi:hypothetical protein